MGSEFTGLLLLLVASALVPLAVLAASLRRRGTGRRPAAPRAPQPPLRMPSSFTRHALAFPLLLAVLAIVIPGVSLVRTLGAGSLGVLAVFASTVLLGVVYARRKGRVIS